MRSCLRWLFLPRCTSPVPRPPRGRPPPCTTATCPAKDIEPGLSERPPNTRRVQQSVDTAAGFSCRKDRKPRAASTQVPSRGTADPREQRQLQGRRRRRPRRPRAWLLSLLTPDAAGSLSCCVTWTGECARATPTCRSILVMGSSVRSTKGGVLGRDRDEARAESRRHVRTSRVQRARAAGPREAGEPGRSRHLATAPELTSARELQFSHFC